VTPTRVVVTGAHTLARSGLCAILNEAPDIDVVGEGEGVGETVSAVRRLKPDLVLIDVLRRDAGTVGLVRKLAQLEAEPTARTLMLVAAVDRHVQELLEVGATGFLLRDAGPAELFAAIQVVAAGYAVVAPATGVLNNGALHEAVAGARDERLSALTPREREVLGLVVRGYSNAEIAADLTLSESTVKYHVQGLLSKLDLHDRVHAVIYAYETGLVQPGDGLEQHP
jgi:DNA-binding NarL/FixJ family response regulator